MMRENKTKEYAVKCAELRECVDVLRSAWKDEEGHAFTDALEQICEQMEGRSDA